MEIKPMTEVSKPSAENKSFDPDKRIDVNQKRDSGKSTEFDPDKRVDVNKSPETKETSDNNSDTFDPDKRVEVNQKQDVKKDTGFDSNNSGDVRDGEKIPEGGSYSEVKKHSDGNTHQVHHMPSDTASHLETKDGPAIRMEKEDHRKTASCGSSKEAKEYQAEQKRLIDEGKFREALQMDIDDIREKFGNKYDNAISEMLNYVDKLESEGKI